MNVHFTYKLSKTADLENLITQRIEKLQKRLQVFRPDMVSLTVRSMSTRKWALTYL